MKETLGILAVVIGIIGYSAYFRDIFAGRTKPHAFSWLVWGMLTGIGFFGQLADHAGPGAWVTGFTAVICTIIFILAIVRGEKQIVLIDWLSLLGAFIALGLWAITNGPLLSVILVTIIDALGFSPTFRKSYFKPFEETPIQYILAGLKFVFAFYALENVSVLTVLYPASLVLMNWVFVVMLFVRRKQLSSPSKAIN